MAPSRLKSGPFRSLRLDSLRAVVRSDSRHPTDSRKVSFRRSKSGFTRPTVSPETPAVLATKTRVFIFSIGVAEFCNADLASSLFLSPPLARWFCFARQVGKTKAAISMLREAAKVFQSVQLTEHFSDKATHLYEISRAPETTWPQLCEALQNGALTTVDDVSKAVARVKALEASLLSPLGRSQSDYPHPLFY